MKGLVFLVGYVNEESLVGRLPGVQVLAELADRGVSHSKYVSECI